MKSNPFEELDEDQVYSELNEEIMEGVLEAIDGCGEKILFLIDDCVNDLRKSPNLQRQMSKIIMNRRHLCGSGGSVSIIMTTQIYNKIPAPIRKCASHISIYSTKNKKESIENLIESNQLFERYTGSWVTQSDVEVYNFTQTYDLGLQYGYDYKNLKGKR